MLYLPAGPWDTMGNVKKVRGNNIREKTRHTALRIGSGAMRGRKILPPAGMTTRPMTSMVKKSLFSILSASGNLSDGVILDLYSGTGTLGLESLSCGARHCYFGERDRHALNRLKRNIETLELADVTKVWAGNLETRLADWLAEMPAGQQVNIAFVDPPYPSARKWNWDKITERIFCPLAEAMAEGGMIVLRLPGDMDAPQQLGPLTCQRVKNYGQMAIGFYSKDIPPPIDDQRPTN